MSSIIISGQINGRATLSGLLKSITVGGSIAGKGSLVGAMILYPMLGSINGVSYLDGPLAEIAPIISYGGTTGQVLKVNIYSPAGVARTDSPLALTEITGKGLYRETSYYVQPGDLMSVYVDGAPTVFIGAGEYQPTLTKQELSVITSAATQQSVATSQGVNIMAIQNIPVIKQVTVSPDTTKTITVGNL